MEKTNRVFIATSLDGYIADKEGKIDWLESVPQIDEVDMGYEDFMADIDALVMGRVTFETVCGFDMEWPYSIPVFVLSHSLTEIPEKYRENVFLLQGSVPDILEQIYQRGFYSLYIDGGKTIQEFLKEDLVDELVITTIPVLLGGGHSLFGNLPQPMAFTCVKSTHYPNLIVQNTYERVRND